LPWQQGSAHNILHGSIESAIPENPLVGPNISGLSAIQVDLYIGDFLCKFWGVNFGRRGLKIEERFVECHMEKWRPKNGSILSRNKKKQEAFDKCNIIGNTRSIESM